MVKKFNEWFNACSELFEGVLIIFFGLFSVAVACLLFIAGCQHVRSQASKAAAIPAAVQYYEVPITDTSTVPDILHLRPGQSAILMEDVVGIARIPAQGNELYTGPVVIEKGTVVIKPMEESQ